MSKIYSMEGRVYSYLFTAIVYCIMGCGVWVEVQENIHEKELAQHLVKGQLRLLNEYIVLDRSNQHVEADNIEMLYKASLNELLLLVESIQSEPKALDALNQISEVWRTEQRLATRQIPTLHAKYIEISNVLQTETAALQQYRSLGAVLFLLSLGGVVWIGLGWFRKRMILPLRQLLQVLKELAQGNTDIKPAGNGKGEIIELQQATANIILNLEKAASFSADIGNGKLEAHFNAVDLKDKLGAALLDMQQKLIDLAEEERKRQWAASNQLKFAELLRRHDVMLQDFAHQVLHYLIHTVKANQGALFISEQEAGKEPVLELASAYAWGKRKYLRQSFAYGEGLIGQVALEKEVVLLTDVPENYVSIGSGLGMAKPRCILLLPLLSNDVLCGVIELACFQVFQEHEIIFLQKIADSIGSVLASKKVENRTTALLKEANALNANLLSQEEELRQNTEELMATQEAMKRKEMELLGVLASINSSLLTAELSLEGQILQLNDKLQRFLGTEKEWMQKAFFCGLAIPDWSQERTQIFFQQLQEGDSQNVDCHATGDANRWISASFTPIKDGNGKIQKIMMLATDISEKKNAEIAFRAQAEAIMEQEEKLRLYTAELEHLQQGLQDKVNDVIAEKTKNVAILEGCVDGVISFNNNGIIEFVNRAAEEICNLPRYELLGQEIQKLIPLEICETDDEPLIFFQKDSIRKILEVRTEVPLNTAGGHDTEVLLTITKAKLAGGYIFTAFVQKVSVELF